MTSDLTTGSVPKRLFRFALPLLFANVLQSLYQLVDMLVVGRFLGSPGLAAVSSAAMLCYVITSLCSGAATGGSVLEVVNVLREAGAEVLGIASIFTYGMQKGLDRLAAAGVKNVSLSNFDVLAEVAAEKGYIRPEQVERLIRFRNNPGDESWMHN